MDQHGRHQSSGGVGNGSGGAPTSQQQQQQQQNMSIQQPPTQQKQVVNTNSMVDGVYPDGVESSTISTYRPPGALNFRASDFQQEESPSPPTVRPTDSSLPPSKNVQYVYNPSDGSVLLDHRGNPVTVDKLLSTKPLRHELNTRVGPGGKKLTYLSGDSVSRTLNDIFGFDGWNLDIAKVQREEVLKDEKGRYTVVYTAIVRLTHKASGTYKEDCGAGDATDKIFSNAISNAVKSSITDAMKRSARHFGDKLGNCK